MKKTSMLIGCVAMAFTLSACSDATANISDGSEKLITIGDESVTKQDIYNILKPDSIGKATLEAAKAEIYKKEDIKQTDELKKKADEKLSELKKQFGDQYETQLKSAGYATDEEVLNALVYPSLYQTELQKKYVTEKADSLFDSYMPMKAQILEASDETKAKDALKAIKNGDDFEKTAKKYGVTTTYTGAETLYTSESSLPADVLSAMTSNKKVGLIDKVITDTTTTKYYIVKLTNITPSEYKDEAIENISQTTKIATEATKYYFKKYNLNIYDIDAYTYFTTNEYLTD